MAEHSVNDLSYGHYGELFYDTDQQKWLSRKHLVNGESLQSLGNPKTYNGSKPDDEDEGKPKKRGAPITRAKRSIAQLQKVMPGFGFADDILEDHASDLDAFARKPAEEDWKVSDLLVHAEVQVHDGRKIRRCGFLAFPGGDSGDILRVVELRDARTGWGMDKKSAWLKTKEIREIDSTSWQADGRIRQICFAHNQVEERHPMLAVRTARSVTVLLPRLSTDVETPSHLALTAGTSRILLEEVVHFPIEAVNNIEFVDLAFNPWFPSTLAAVSEYGQFYLWTLLPFRQTFDQNETVTGESTDLDLEDDDNGWHKILWTSNSSFIICNRRRVKAFRRRGKDAICMNQDVLASDPNHIITDLRRSPIEDIGLFITTTSHIMYLRSSRDMRNSEADLSYTTVFSWRHNRDHHDTSLKLSFAEEQENALRIMLFSRSTPLITTYELASTSHDIPLLLTNSSTSISNFITIPNATSPRARPTDIVTMDAKLCGRLTLPGTSIDADSWLAKCLANGYTFFQSFSLTSDLTFSSQLAYTQKIDLHREHSIIGLQSLFIPAPIWTQVRKRQHRVDTTTAGEDDFIEADDAQSRGSSSVRKRSLRYSQMLQLGARASWNEIASAVFDLRVAFDGIYKTLRESDGTSAVSSRDLPNELSAKIQDVSQSMTLRPLISFLMHRSFHGLDLGLDVQSKVTERLTEDLARHCSVGLLGNLAELGLDRLMSQVSPAALHEALLDIFIRHLSSRVQREHTERLQQVISDVAWQIVLACLAVRPVAVSAQDSSTTGSSRDQAFSSQALPSSQSVLHSSAVAAETSDQADEAEIDDSATKAQAVETIAHHVEYLRRFVEVNNPPTSQSDAVARLTNHWAMGEDPATYKYKTQADTVDLEGSAMTAETSRRIKRKKQKEMEREAKRRKLDDRAAQSQSSQLSQRQAMPFMSSQASGNTRQLRSHAFSQAPLSSQSADSQLYMASQPVAGPHGGRPAAANRNQQGGRRGRRAGF